MKKLLFDFIVDKPAKTVYVTREFDAPLSLVWEAFTTKEILDKWTAPAPWLAKTKHMNFTVGGKRFYAMIGPEGQERWIIQTYTSITPTSNFKLLNAFADKDEKPELPGSEWDYSFSEQNGITKVNITVFNESYERMDGLLEGFKQGYIKALENLDGFLSARKIPANRTVSINLPVKDLQRSINFYTALGFQNYPYTSGDSVKYLVWSEHISLTLMSPEKFASLVPKSLADTKHTMASFYTLSVSSLEELNEFIDRGLDAGGVEPTEKDDYGIMHQRTIEDFDGHCWNVMYIDRAKILAEQQMG